jgi:hypothetical protein
MDLKHIFGLIPKVLVLGFAASLVLPAPYFIHGMSQDLFVVWLARLLWVLVLSIGCGLVFLTLGRLKGRKKVDSS